MSDEPVTKDEVNAAYDKIDRYLRNNLGDSDYSEFSDALDMVCAYGAIATSGADALTEANSDRT
jgi:hypothetical protein